MNTKKRQNQKIKHKSGTPPAKKGQIRYVWLNVLPDDVWLNIPQGQSIFEALQNTNLVVDGECGGMGKCGKCKVKVLSRTDPPTKVERELLDDEELKQGIRLACRTRVNQDLEISVGEPATHAEYHKILTTSHILETGPLPILCFEPLVHKRLLTIPPHLQHEELSDLDRVRTAIGPKHQDLKATLYCLHTLYDMLRRTEFSGAAVIHEEYLMAWQEREEELRSYGLIFDLGTTTVVGKLISMVDGSEVAVASCLNSQSRYGTDVISRLQYVIERTSGLDNLHNLIIKNMNRITAQLLKTGGINMNEIFVAVAAGNTTMQHLALNLNPSGIAESPFSPVLTDGLTVKAADVGLELNPDALFYVMPAKAGYIGGDLISVVLASGAWEQEDETILGMDFGTNGEIFLGNAKRLMTCSAAAGPALEGARISRGMIAKAGAIEAVSLEQGDIQYQVIGNIKPKGICGSGLVELVATLLDLGIIDYEGLICPPDEGAAEGLSSRVIERSGVNEFLIASSEESYDHRPIYLTQKDIRELQLAKSAIAAGIKTLMDEMGIGPEDIDRVYLAGALGNYVNPDSAMRIGLIPRFDPDIVTSLGNAASTGASIVLLSRDYWKMANQLAHSIEHVEMSSRLDFNEHFIDQMDFPREKELGIRHEEIADVMKTVTVKEVMTRDFPTISFTMALKEVTKLARNTGHHGFPILDDEGHLFGVVTMADLERSIQSGNTDRPVAEVATQSPLVAYPDQTLYEVLQASEKDYGRIPVVDPQDPGHLLGVLRRHDIIRAYRSRVAQKQRDER